MKLKQPKYNQENNWVKLPRWKKRLRGFSSYLILAFYSLWVPEVVDWVLFNDLRGQFDDDAPRFERREMMQRKTIIDITPTPDELAFEFSIMDEEQQAMFFNELARITEKWSKPLCFQLQSIIDHPALTPAGRSIMERIGEYGGVTR